MLFYLVLFSCTVFSQSEKNNVEYKGGFGLLYKTINKYIHSGNRIITSGDSNRYYNIVVVIDKKGTVKSESIFSVNKDTSEIAIILSVIKRTNGKWVNHSSNDQIIVLPIYYMYNDDESNTHKKIPNISQDYYGNGNKTALLYLNPIIVIIYPTIIDKRGLKKN
jgi:hypothetical protein